MCIYIYNIVDDIWVYLKTCFTTNEIKIILIKSQGVVDALRYKNTPHTKYMLLYTWCEGTNNQSTRQ